MNCEAIIDSIDVHMMKVRLFTQKSADFSQNNSIQIDVTFQWYAMSEVNFE